MYKYVFSASCSFLLDVSEEIVGFESNNRRFRLAVKGSKLLRNSSKQF